VMNLREFYVRVEYMHPPRAQYWLIRQMTASAH